MTFPISKKRINTEMSTASMAALFIRESRIRRVTYEGVQHVGGASIPCTEKLTWVDIKRCGNERSGVNVSWNEFYRNVIRRLMLISWKQNKEKSMNGAQSMILKPFNLYTYLLPTIGSIKHVLNHNFPHYEICDFQVYYRPWSLFNHLKIKPLINVSFPW